MSIASSKQGQEALLLWCQTVTKDYKEVKITNWTSSWRDGKALCAIIHKHRPDAILWDMVAKGKGPRNLQMAFSAAEKLGIESVLEVADFEEAESGAVIIYVSKFYFLFHKKPEEAESQKPKRVNVSTLRGALNLNMMGMVPGARPVRPRPTAEMVVEAFTDGLKKPAAEDEEAAEGEAEKKTESSSSPSKESESGSKIVHLTRNRVGTIKGSRRLPTRRKTRLFVDESAPTNDDEQQPTHESKDHQAENTPASSSSSSDGDPSASSSSSSPSETQPQNEAISNEEQLQKIAAIVGDINQSIVPRVEAELTRITNGAMYFNIDWSSFRGQDVNSFEAITTLHFNNGEFVFQRILQLVHDLCNSHPTIASRIPHEIFNEIRISNISTHDPRQKDAVIDDGVLHYRGVFEAGPRGCLVLAESRPFSPIQSSNYFNESRRLLHRA